MNAAVSILRIANVPSREDLESQNLGFDKCSRGECQYSPSFMLFRTLQRNENVFLRRDRLCDAHAKEWCDAYDVAPADVPAVDFIDSRNLLTPTPGWPVDNLPVLVLAPWTGENVPWPGANY